MTWRSGERGGCAWSGVVEEGRGQISNFRFQSSNAMRNAKREMRDANAEGPERWRKAEGGVGVWGGGVKLLGCVGEDVGDEGALFVASRDQPHQRAPHMARFIMGQATRQLAPGLAAM